jgi:hypothetical protein
MREAFSLIKERAEKEWRRLCAEVFILIGAATCGVSAGAERVEERLRERVKREGVSNTYTAGQSIPLH